MLTCIECKTELPENAKFCLNCGTQAPKPVPEQQQDDPLRGLPPILEAKQVAEMLNVSVNRLYEYFKKGDIPARKLGRRWRVSTRRLFEWLDGQKTG